MVNRNTLVGCLRVNEQFNYLAGKRIYRNITLDGHGDVLRAITREDQRHTKFPEGGDSLSSPYKLKMYSESTKAVTINSLRRISTEDLALIASNMSSLQRLTLSTSGNLCTVAQFSVSLPRLERLVVKTHYPNDANDLFRSVYLDAAGLGNEPIFTRPNLVIHIQADHLGSFRDAQLRDLSRPHTLPADTGSSTVEIIIDGGGFFMNGFCLNQLPFLLQRMLIAQLYDLVLQCSSMASAQMYFPGSVRSYTPWKDISNEVESRINATLSRSEAATLNRCVTFQPISRYLNQAKNDGWDKFTLNRWEEWAAMERKMQERGREIDGRTGHVC